MSQYSREQLLELAAGYAVGATTPEESAAIEAALPTSPELAAEVASFRDVAVKLAQQHATAPSPAVRAAFLDRISASKNATVVTLPRRASRAPLWMGLALAASILLVARLQMQNGELRRTVSERETALAAAKAEAERQHSQLNALLEADKDLFLVHLKTGDTVAGPGMQFFWNQKQHVALLHAFRLKPAPAGRAYQVWLLVKGKPVGVGVFNSDLDGNALVQNFQLPESVAGVTDVLVTEEPAGGSTQPTTTPFIGGKMPAL